MRRIARNSLHHPLPLIAWLVVLAACAGQRQPRVAVAPGPPVDRPAANAPAATAPACPACVDARAPSLVAAYTSALDAARVPDSDEISRDLTPLLPSTKGLSWRDGLVLMATWTNLAFYLDESGQSKYRPGDRFALHGETWLTAVPAVRDFCRGVGLEGSMLALRLEQRLGLPPSSGKSAFLEIWVDPSDVFRPCPDPEISDRECLVRVPIVGAESPAEAPADPPWACQRDQQQVSGRFVTVNPDHLSWMCAKWLHNYGDRDPMKNYPWTALGYTYDWGNPDDPVGPSEFVAVGKSQVVFHSLKPTAEYCAPPLPGERF